MLDSVAFVAAPRAAFTIMEDPDDGDRRLFLHLKNNLGRRPQGLAFHLHDDRIVGKDEQGDFVASYVVWDTAPVQATADETLNAGSSNGADGEGNVD